MTRKCLLFACALFTSAAMLSFTGCGDNKKPAAPATPAPDATTTPATPAPDAAPPAAKGEHS